ncbi:MAG: PD-(D/E)XK nuclease family protein [Pseudomonadota bacterium]
MPLDEAKLEALFVANDEFGELENALEVFCPFEAVGMVHQEIRHGHFLSYIFDPQRPHGFGSDCLRALMSAVAKSAESTKAGLKQLDVHLMDFDGAIVRREWRNIDILIEIPDQKLVIAIELKIDATEHSGQLERYKDLVQREWPSHRNLLLFLTKRGDDPSDNDAWISVPLEFLASELALLVGRRPGSDASRTMLDAYLAMLGRHHLTDERLDELAKSLWAKHREALEFLSDRRPDEMTDLFQLVFENRKSIAKRFSEVSGFRVVPDHSTSAFVRFAVEDWDEIPGMLSGEGWTDSKRLLLIELSRRDKAVTIRFQMGPGDSETRQRIFGALENDGRDLGGNWALSPKWRQLANKQLIKLKDDGSADIDQAYDNLVSQAEAFLSRHLSEYDESFRALQP